MKYFKVDDNIYIKYDSINKTVQIVSKKALQELSNKLTKEVPQVPTDEELLEWARKNYPGINNIGDGQKRLDEVNSEISELDKIKIAIVK